MKRLFYVLLMASSILINMIFLAKFLYNKYNIKNTNNSKFKPYTEMVKEVYANCPNDSNEIILLGNSITAAFKADEFYPDLNIKNRGISGDQTIDILSRLSEITESKPKKIFLMVGVNDIIHGVDEKTILNNYIKIVSQIKAECPETELFLQSILPLAGGVSEYYKVENRSGNERIDRMNEEIKSLAIEKKINYVDLNTNFRMNGELNKEYSWDGIHINAKGYQFWNKCIASLIVSQTN